MNAIALAILFDVVTVVSTAHGLFGTCDPIDLQMNGDSTGRTRIESKCQNE